MKIRSQSNVGDVVQSSYLVISIAVLRRVHFHRRGAGHPAGPGLVGFAMVHAARPMS